MRPPRQPDVAPTATAVLRACGWLAADATLADLRDLSSSHDVRCAVRSDGAEAIIKQRRSGRSRGIANELFVYRLAGWLPDLAAILPRAWHIDERHQILVLEALPGVRGFGQRLTDPAAMRRIGETLATVHRATIDQPILPSPAAGIFQVAVSPDATGRDRPYQTQTLMRRIAGDRVLRETLQRGKADYRARCLIHGDLRPDHWIESTDGTLRLLDWEMGGGGDPMLDLAAAFVEPTLEAIRAGAPRHDWLARTDAVIRPLFDGYRARGGEALIEGAGGHAHVVRLGAARLLHVACEWSDIGTLAPSVEALVTCARTLAASLEAVSQRIAA